MYAFYFTHEELKKKNKAKDTSKKTMADTKVTHRGAKQSSY